jgi:hypothetical protein
MVSVGAVIGTIKKLSESSESTKINDFNYLKTRFE